MFADDVELRGVKPSADTVLGEKEVPHQDSRRSIMLSCILLLDSVIQSRRRYFTNIKALVESMTEGVHC